MSSRGREPALYIRLILSYSVATRRTMASSNEKLSVPVSFLIFFTSLLIVDALIIAAKHARSRFNVGTTPRYTSRPTTPSLAGLLISQMCDGDLRLYSQEKAFLAREMLNLHVKAPGMYLINSLHVHHTDKIYLKLAFSLF